MTKTILHITAGDDNWTPTQKELTSLRNKFVRAMKAAKPGHTPVIVTRDSVFARLVEFDHMPVVTSGYIAPVQRYGNFNEPQFTVTTTTANGNPK